MLTDTEMTIESAIDTPDLDGAVLLIESSGGGTSDHAGTASPGRHGLRATSCAEAGVIASSETDSRANCIRQGTRELIARDIYAVPNSGEFLAVGASATESEEIEHFGFRYVQRGVKNRDPVGSDTCAETTLIEITATALRYEPLD